MLLNVWFVGCLLGLFTKLYVVDGLFDFFFYFFSPKALEKSGGFLFVIDYNINFKLNVTVLLKLMWDFLYFCKLIFLCGTEKNFKFISFSGIFFWGNVF